jgi:UDP:flavonoid glycosyltransferase YjiC (YdhE family)
VNVLLLAIGSHGDVHPFVGLGMRLRARGHAVTVAANEMFEPLVKRAGLGFAQIGAADDYIKLAQDPALWSRTKAFQTVMQRGVLPSVRPMYDLCMNFASKGNSIIAGSSLALGMRLAEEKLKQPMTLIHLAPAIIRTVHNFPVLPGTPIRAWMPSFLKRFVYFVADYLIIDPTLKKSVNEIRKDIGLPALKTSVWAWWNNAARVIGMWPEWFGPWQPDWPENLKLTGFPLYDEQDHRQLGEALTTFIAAGSAPVAFTAGSAMWSDHHFFEESVEACQRGSFRGILLTKHRENLPAKLPDSVIHVDYAPFSLLLPKCAATVHHGGIGTTAQALAAGHPQIVMPFAHDQLDNANRVVMLGCGAWIEPKRYRAKNVAKTLLELDHNYKIKRRCQQVKQLFSGADPLTQTAQLLEQLSQAGVPSEELFP